MKELFLATAAFMALAVSAPAADLARPYAKTPVSAPIFSWGGFYIGMNGGSASAHKCWDLSSSAFLPVVPATAEGCHHATGGIVGGQIGYRWQASNWVFGLEAQGDWTNLTGSHPTHSVAADRTRVDAIGSLTGQIGYAWNNVLWYVKGGAAVAHDTYNGAQTTGTASDGATETRASIGTGFEVGIDTNWLVGAEYSHLFMGTRDVALTNTSTSPPLGRSYSRTDRISQDVDMATVHINYRWGGPILAKY